MRDALDLERVMGGATLSRDEADTLMEAVLAGEVSTERLCAALAVLRFRGETTDEMLGFRDAMMRRAVRIPVELPVLLDTCGTGGDRLGTFNVSTAVAVVVASCGVPVAKHGNRSVSSQSGSSDVLEAAGVRLVEDPDLLARLLTDLGLAFMHAPFHHPALKLVGPTRKALGVMTLFNLLGPMANPAPLTHQLVGVPRAAFMHQYGAIYAARPDITRAAVVHGRDGADEALPGGTYEIVEVRDATATHRVEDPARHGVSSNQSIAAFRGGDARANAATLQSVLAGEGPVAIQDAVALNAGIALHLAGAAQTTAEGVAMSRQAMASAEPLRLLRAYAARVAS